MNRIYLDYEIRSEVDIHECGGWVYSLSPTSVVLLMAYAINDGSVQQLHKEYFERSSVPLPDDLLTAFMEDFVIVAHNAFFERVIWNNLCAIRYGWPIIPIENWIDTMAKARAYSLPGSLDGAGAALGLPVRKDERGKYLVKQLCCPRPQPQKPKPDWSKWDNDPQKMIEFAEYNVTDVVVLRLLDKRLPDLNEIETQVWREDQKMNTYGVPVDLLLAKSCIKLIKQYEKIHTSELGNLTGGKVTKATQVARIKEWLGYQDIEVTSLDKASILRLKDQGVPEEVAHILWIRQQFGKSSTAKYARFLQMTDPTDSRTRGALEYHRASTGRWGGRGVQLHNLPKDTVGFGNLRGEDKMDAFVEMIRYEDIDLMEMIFPDVMGVFSSAIRGMVVAEPGHELFVVDYGQIEARVIMWLAGEEDGLTKFRNGEDLYLDMAERVYQVKGLTKEKNRTERDLGKATVLGAGFQMGWKRFMEQAKEQYGLIVSADLAKDAVSSYRSTYRKVKDFWYAMIDAATTAVIEKRTVECGKVKFGMRGGFLLMQLPSKRFLAYYAPRLMKKDYTEEQKKKLIEAGDEWKIDKVLLTYMAEENKQWRRTSTYGGNLAQHATQAIARDIMANGLLNLSATGRYTNLLSIHDEGITQAKIGEGDLSEVESLMCQQPEWAKDIPIVVEGWKGKRYHK